MALPRRWVWHGEGLCLLPSSLSGPSATPLHNQGPSCLLHITQFHHCKNTVGRCFSQTFKLWEHLQGLRRLVTCRWGADTGPNTQSSVCVKSPVHSSIFLCGSSPARPVQGRLAMQLIWFHGALAFLLIDVSVLHLWQNLDRIHD